MNKVRVAACLALLAGTAGAQTPGGNPASVPEKMICRRDTATGSIMPGRVCHPKSQWAKIDRASEATMENRRTSNTMDRSQGGAGNGTDSFGQSRF